MSNFIIILLTLIFSAFFSGMEIAFISSNRLRIELERKQGARTSKIIAVFIKNPAEYIATMLVGNNIALVIYGITMSIILEPVIEQYISSSKVTILITQTIISTLIILITAEFLPKTLFRVNPNSSLNIFAIPVFVFYIIFYPIVKFSLWVSNLILKRFLEVDIYQKEHIAFGKVDLDNFFNESKGKETETEMEHDVKMFQNALDFADVKLRECIVPRTEIVALEVGDMIQNLRNKFVETGFSKILIYEESIDNIIGYVHSSELFKNPESIKSMLLKLPIVPETMPANKLLASFIKNGKGVAVVVDEFGGTSGMVTIEDIMEEIFGEIEDEHDYTALVERQLGEDEFVFAGRLEIDYINEKYNLELPESDDYETIAGLILFNHESIPNNHEVILVGDFKIRILKVSKTKIELVNLKIVNQE